MNPGKSIRGLLQNPKQADLARGFRDVERRIEQRRVERAAVRKRQGGAVTLVLAAACVLAFLSTKNPAAMPEARPLAAITSGPAPVQKSPENQANPSVDTRFDRVISRDEVAQALELRKGARVKQLDASGEAHKLMLEEGSIALHLQESNDEPWTVHVDDTRIDAAGADFEVRRVGTSLEVKVFRGAVLVSETRSGQAQRVQAGRTVTFAEEDEPADLAKGPAHTASAARPTLPSVARGKNKPDDVAQGRDLVAERLLEADQARARGDLHGARVALTAIVTRESKDRRAGTAAFTLGKLELDLAQDALAAARSFELALELGLPSALLEDARARLAEARARSENERSRGRTREAHEESPQATGDLKIDP